MTSKTQITNIALGRIGSTVQVGNVETENSREARNARLFLDDDRKYVLRDFPWPWATEYVSLALVAGSSTDAVNDDWQYSYRYPSDCHYARRLVVASAGRNNPEPPPFRLGRDSQGKLIYTNEEDAVLEYTVNITEYEEFDPMFVSMLAWKLAASLAPSLSKIKGMAQECMAMYEIDKEKAQSRALNEGQQDKPVESEMVRARE